MKTIPLTQGKVALVDDEDYADLMQFKWHAAEWGKTFCAIRNLRINGKRTVELLHRRVMRAKRGEQVDHKNHDGLDCQKYNLRVCLRSQNQMNALKHGICASAFKGVGWHKDNKKWVARITHDGKRISLGYFRDEKAAAYVYDEAARKYFGEFALTNFPVTGG